MHHMVSAHCSYVMVSWEGTETGQEATGTIWNMGNFNWIQGKYFCYVGDQAPKPREAVESPLQPCRYLTPDSSQP